MRVIVTMSFLVFSAAFYLHPVLAGRRFRLRPLAAVVQGIGVAMFFNAAYEHHHFGARAKDIANASSLSTAHRVLAGSIGSSSPPPCGNGRKPAPRPAHRDPSTRSTGGAARAQQLTQWASSPEQAKVWVATEITRQGFLLGFNELFWLASIAFIGLAGLVWLSHPQQENPVGGRMAKTKRNAGKERKRAREAILDACTGENSPQRGTPERVWKTSPGGPG